MYEMIEQTGPLAHSVGHEINYISLIRVLHAMGRANLLSDYGGGALFLINGILSAHGEKCVNQ